MSFALAVFAIAIAATPHPRPSQAAPADAYFGRTKLSALGIRNEIALLARRYRERTSSDADIVHDATLAQDALGEWERAYPKDPWMAPTLFHLEQLYAEVQTADARTRAIALLHEIAGRYPQSKEAHLSRVRLAQGYGELHAESPTHATPNPYANAASTTTATTVASPAAGASPDVAASGAPAAAPSASPSALPMPTPSPRDR